MTFGVLYLIFALTTGAVSCIYLVAPALAKYSANDVSRPNAFWAYIVVGLLGALLAPIFAVFIVVPALGTAFTDGLAGKH